MNETARQSYDAICRDMKKIVDQLESNPTMPEEEFSQILNSYEKLGKLLDQYAKMMYKV